jgi:uncharacterized protein YggE
MLGRKVLYGLAAVVLVVALGGLAVAYAGGPNSPRSAVNSADSIQRGITVVGVGKASGAPDVAQVTIGVDTQAPSVQKAVDDNKTQMNALLSTLKGLGIADKDLQTNNYSVYTEQKPAPDGASSAAQLVYHVSNQVQVTVRDINQLGDVLDKAVAAGANNIYGVSFSVEDTARLEADARAKAVADAKSRAESMAQLNGLQLGEVVNVSEVIDNSGIFPLMSGAKGMGGGGAPIQPGELEMNMSIQITYAVK